MLEEWTSSAALQTLGVVVVVTVVVQAVRWLLAYRSFFLFFNSLPGEPDFSWIWGNLHKIPEASEKDMRYMDDLTKACPKFFRLWNGPFAVSIFLHHPDTLKDLFKTDGPKGWTYQFIRPWIGWGMLTSSGAQWHRSRRLLTPAFHFDILKPYNTISNRACDLLLQKVEKHAEEKKSMEMYDNISLFTFDVILQCAMSYTDDIQTKGDSHPYVQAVGEMSDIIEKRYRNPLYYWDWMFALTPNGRRYHQLCDDVHRQADRVISARRATLEREGPPKKRHLDFLDILLTAKDGNGEGLTPSEVRDEVHTFMFAGHDTTASSISWTLYSLCQHPDIQHRVQQEVDTILQGRDSDDIEWSDLSHLEYLTQVIKEGMRLHCPVPFVDRVLDKPLSVDGVTLPVGTLCVISMQTLHHNPAVWDDPYVFDPDRFHPDNAKGRDSFAFVPFSAGPRNCIGQNFALNEQKVVLARLLRRFTFSLDSSHKVEKKMSVVMRTDNGMKMFAEPRNLSPSA